MTVCVKPSHPPSFTISHPPSLSRVARFGGPQSTVASGASQFFKTFIMRLGFSWAWNWCTTQQLPMPVFDEFIRDAK